MDGKDLLRSKAFWGIVAILLAATWRHAGISVDGVDLDGVASDLTLLGGAALAIVGRFKARQAIGSVAGIPLTPKGGPNA